MHHILILTKGIIWEKSGPSDAKLNYLRKYFSGDVVYSAAKRHLVSGEWNGFYLCGCYVPLWAFNKLGPIYSLYFFLYIFARCCYRHYFVKRYDCIIARDPIIVGPLGLVLSKLCKVPYVIEMNGNYANEIVWNEGKPSTASKLKFKLAMKLVPFILNRAKGIRILYPQQLEPYAPRLKLIDQKVACFHEFTQISNLTPSNTDDQYILLIGAPAYIKGADILIKAFIKIQTEFPDYRLKIVGWYSQNQQNELILLGNHSSRIEILPPVSPEKAQTIIDKCTFFVLPSRTEGMGRVLLEAMAHGKALVGSNIEGIPHYIHHETNGLLFDTGDENGLAEAMKRLLSHPDQRSFLGKNGQKLVTTQYSEDVYAKEYQKLISSVVSSAPNQLT